MFDDLHDLVDLSDSDLALPRARSLVIAARAHRDFTVIRTARRDGSEVIVVDVECDRVPPKNPHGIKFRERLALVVPNDTKQLVAVYALRCGFPVLIHENQGSREGLPSLCLYFEPVAVVTRTWTAQRFLARIQWWLEQTAQGTLHPADQPVEHLFFASRYELVLPWNIDELQTNKNVRFTIRASKERHDGGITLFLDVPKTGEPTSKAAALVVVETKPVIHGFIERDPQKLGELVDLLRGRGVDFMSLLRAAILDGYDDHGKAERDIEPFVVILVQIPVVREAGSPPERMARRGFVIHRSAGDLGVLVGALFKDGDRYFRDLARAVLGGTDPTEWRTEAIAPAEVHQKNTAAAARFQSGINEEGPVGTLIGAGALGSAILNLWGRGGWGQWTVIDPDHIKPHNLSRHTAFAGHVGYHKTDVVAHLHRETTEGASSLKPIAADACDITNTDVREALSPPHVVVDASTTLEYPRLASTQADLGRHISIFLTPNGNSSVLMAEDANRSHRLRSLEAQYYRSMIRESWGDQHLAGSSTFWSGAGCRDISMVLPYSRISAHASTLAEQVMSAVTKDQALLRVWQRMSDSGEVAMYEIPVRSERDFPLGKLTLYLDAGVEQHLHALRASNLPSETGGVLLGYFDFNVMSVVVVDALPAPLDSKASPGYFERGIEGLAQAVKEASRRTAGIVQYVGEWHSHPPGYSANASPDDFIQLVHLALDMHDEGLPGIQLIVGEGDIQVHSGAVL